MKHTVPIKANIHNRFDIEVVRDGKTVQKAYAENIILNALWTRMFAPNTWNSYIFFGTGAGELSASRTSLFTHLGYKANGSSLIEDHHEDGYISCRHRISLAPEEYVGQELSEVGIGYGTSSTNLVTHATLKDMNGNPTTIEKTALDIINIYATVYIQVPTTFSWASGGIAFPEDSGNYDNFRSSGVINILFGLATPFMSDQFTNAVFSIFKRAVFYAGTLDSSKTYTVLPTFAYDVANKKTTISHRIPVGSANFSEGIGSCEIVFTPQSTGMNGPYFQICVDFTNPSVFTGSVREAESVGEGDGATQDFKTAYQIKPGSTPTVYVDGTPVSTGITVDVGKPVSDDISAYMKTIGRDFSNGATMPTSWGDGAYSGKVGLTADLIFENTLYGSFGIYQLTLSYSAQLYVSNDMETWILAAERTIGKMGPATIPEEYRGYKYWKVVMTDSGSYGEIATPAKCLELVDNTANIHFSTPPDVGAVITVDYVTPWVAKDTNHVFDFTLELQFGEYTP